MACFELLCKTFESYVKLLNFANLQTTEYQRNKKFYVKLLPLVENFISKRLHDDVLRRPN